MPPGAHIPSLATPLIFLLLQERSSEAGPGDVCACVCTRVLFRACSSPVTLWITSRTCYTARAHYQVVVTHVCARARTRVCVCAPSCLLQPCHAVDYE